MGDSGEEREREWGIAGKKGERVGDSGEDNRLSTIMVCTPPLPTT